jgi:hypothetical protein
MSSLVEDEQSPLRVVFRKNPSDVSEIERLNYLYNDTDVDVKGRVDTESRNFLERTYKSVTAASLNMLRKVGLYPIGKRNTLRVEPIPLKDGVVGGYTDGTDVTINSNIIPGTDDYRKSMDWYRNLRGKLGKYIYDKFGTPENARENVRYVTGHEVGHIPQLNRLRTKKGKITPVFRDEILNALKERYAANLPKWAKGLSTLLALISHKGPLEGLNEVYTENVFKGRDTGQIRYDPTDVITSYDGFKKAANSSLYDMGYRTAAEYYGDWAENPRKMAHQYLDGYFKAMGSHPGGKMKQAA